MEGRHQERKQIIYYLRVLDAQSGDLLGHVADVSTSGLMMTSERRLTKGKTIPLLIELPKSMKGPQQLALKARVKWSRPDQDSSFFNTGLRFLHLSGSDTNVLADLIQNYLYQEPPDDEDPEGGGRP